MKPIVLALGIPFGAFALVKYPYAKGNHLYIMAEGKPVACCQCSAEMAVEDWLAHIRSHDRRKGDAPICTPEGKEIESLGVRE